MHFTPKTLDFLFENRLNDSREWYREHKDTFTEYVDKPMRELSEKLMGVITELDEGIDKMHLSRIYRDTRFSKGKSIFRENMWCSFSRVKELYKSLPAFYIDISANGFEYGCGFYAASAESMNAMRQMILSDSPLYSAAEEAFEAAGVFGLYGDMYKRDRYPEASEEKKKWLNRKTIGATALCKDWELIFSDRLADKVSEDIRAIAPVYRFLLEAGRAGTACTESRR